MTDRLSKTEFYTAYEAAIRASGCVWCEPFYVEFMERVRLTLEKNSWVWIAAEGSLSQQAWTVIGGQGDVSLLKLRKLRNN